MVDNFEIYTVGTEVDFVEVADLEGAVDEVIVVLGSERNRRSILVQAGGNAPSRIQVLEF